MTPIIVEEVPFRSMVARLRQFEGVRCVWRLPAAALLYALPALIFVGATVLAGFIAANGFEVWSAAVGSIVVGVGGLAIRHLSGRRLWRKIVADRLWTFEKPNPSTEVPVLVHSRDTPAAREALMRARFSPQFYGVRLGMPPEHAPDLNYKLAVHEPDAWPQSTSDDDRTRRVAAVLEAAGIRAFVGGVETRPLATKRVPAPTSPQGP